MAINSRARFSADLSSFHRTWDIHPRTIFSVNPKTEKSKVQTYILHLSPADTAGINICPGAGACRAVCLHFAGNPVYMAGKGAARIRRTQAFHADRQNFMLTVVSGILYKLQAHNEPLAFRLNGTSDVVWENIDCHVSAEFSTFCTIKFGIPLPTGNRNIFELFNIVSALTGKKIKFYDYTKVKHNWQECERLGYHLTVSYDGEKNDANHKICADALSNGINVAAAFNIKKGKQLPLYVDGHHFSPDFAGRKFPVQDGDLTDYRPGDTTGGSVIGLRFKLPHGVKYTESERDAFCIA